MGLEPRLEEILRAGNGELPDPDELADPEYRMRCIRAAYGNGYVDALTEPEPLEVEDACVKASQDWLRLPVC